MSTVSIAQTAWVLKGYTSYIFSRRATYQTLHGRWRRAPAVGDRNHPLVAKTTAE